MHGFAATNARRASIAAFLASVLLAASPAHAQLEPARLRSGATPTLPLSNVVGSGQAWLLVSLNAEGVVTSIDTLSVTAPFDDIVRAAVRRWTFSPATEDGEPLTSGSEVLVVAIFRPPSLHTLAAPSQPRGTPGSNPRPAPVPIPVATAMPVYPTNAVGSGTVIVEAEVTLDGAVGAAAVIRSHPGFDRSALDAARRWRFQPATRNGRPVPSVAYLVFGFREPAVVSPARR